MMKNAFSFGKPNPTVWFNLVAVFPYVDFFIKGCSSCCCFFFLFFFLIFNLVLLSLGLLNFNVSFLLFNAIHFLVFNSNKTVITSGFSLSLRRELNKCLLIKWSECHQVNTRTKPTETGMLLTSNALFWD